jgi:MFS family permease
VLLQVFPGLLGEQLMSAFNITPLGLSFLASTYFYVYAFMQIPAGLMLDRFAIHQVIIFPLLMCSVGVLLFSCAHSIALATFARILMGTGSAFAFISVLVIAKDLFAPKYFAFLTGLAQLLGATGACLGNAPLLYLFNKLHNWRSVLIFVSVAGFLLVGVIAQYLYSRKRLLAKKSHVPLAKTLRVIFTNRQVNYISLYACFSWAAIPVFASLWGIPFLTSWHHFTKLQAANANSFLWIGFALGSPFVGWFSDFIARRRIPLVATAVLGLAATLALLLINQSSFMFTTFLLFCVGLACAGQALCFAIVQENVEPGMAAGAIGFNNMIIIFFGAILQNVTGKIIATHGAEYVWGVLILPVCFMLSLFISVFLIKETFCRLR